MNLHRARNEEIATIVAGIVLYAIGMTYLFRGAALDMAWLFALPVVGMGLIFVAMVAYATYREGTKEEDRPPHDHAVHSSQYWSRF